MGVRSAEWRHRDTEYADTMITYSYSDPRSCHPPPPPPHPSLPPPSYTEHQSPDPRRSLTSSDRVTILLRCPPVSACVWCVKLYSTVLAGCVVLFSFLWVIGHSYVLSLTEEGTLRVQRYVDIVLGLSFLATHLVLMYSSKHESRSHLTLYFVLSVSTLLLYWSWFVYLKYGVGENEASKEMSDISLAVTMVYIILLVPIVLLYKTLQARTSLGDDIKDDV